MYLVIKEGYEAGRAYKLREGNTIAGRNPTCQIALPDDVSVSRQHVRFTRQPDGICTVMDLNSTNGTFLDGKRLLPNVPTTLEPGTTLQVGRTTFEFVAQYTPSRAPRPLPPTQDQDIETMFIRAGKTDLAQAQRAGKIVTSSLDEPGE
jgi:pSer/pThr/pTyr-binding forkhead associated (FHA) protein